MPEGVDAAGRGSASEDGKLQPRDGLRLSEGGLTSLEKNDRVEGSSDGNMSAERGPGGVSSKKQGVEVSADNVWKAFLSTRPSLSSEDRAQYDSAYQKFRGGSRPADFNPVSSVDDGSLRTALK